jgi:hypothetical protein
MFPKIWYTRRKNANKKRKYLIIAPRGFLPFPATITQEHWMVPGGVVCGTGWGLQICWAVKACWAEAYSNVRRSTRGKQSSGDGVFAPYRKPSRCTTFPDPPHVCTHNSSDRETNGFLFLKDVRFLEQIYSRNNAATALICAGEVPQHPPTNRAPASMH